MIELIDGEIVDIKTDKDYIQGCPTCDYGSQYINYITIITTKFEANFVINFMYDYAYDDLLQIILPNIDIIKKMCELEFIQWFLNDILEKRERRVIYSLREGKIKYSLFDKNKNSIIEENIF